MAKVTSWLPGSKKRKRRGQGPNILFEAMPPIT
jgi:hypothetical protein